jgi:lipoyl-dependent peroxiredoxin
MADVERHAEVIWTGDLAGGQGTIGGTSSGAIGDLPVTWAARTGVPEGKTSPEELIASAHAACYAMAFSHALAEAGSPPTRLTVRASTRFDYDAGKVTRSDLTVRGEVPGLDDDGFRRLAEEGERGCPVSNALRGGVEIGLDAALDA